MSAPLSVELLHLLVPAAEELDLLEQHAAGQLPLLEPDSAPTSEATSEAAEAPPTPTHAQAVAIVQRYLGGTVLEG